MARAEIQRRLSWRLADVVEVVMETPRVSSIFVTVPGWPGHRAGQHIDVRLTADDGYQAERSYSIATAPEDGERLALTVERVEGGEVSPYLLDELRPGDRLELRGPIGGYFVWDARMMTDPLFLVAGGSGVCPLMAMLRHRAATGSRAPARMLYSARSWDDVIYRADLERGQDGLEVSFTLTRSRPPGWKGYHRRVDEGMLAEVGWRPADSPLAFVCGPTPFVESVAEDLVALGHPADRIKTERFGPTGG